MRTIRRILLTVSCLTPFSVTLVQSQIYSNEKNPDYRLNLTEGITIIEQPQNDITCLGGDANFKIVIESDEYFYFNWKTVGGEYYQSDSLHLIYHNVEYDDTLKGFFCHIYSGTDTISSDTAYISLALFPEIISPLPEGPTNVAYSGEPIPYQIKHQGSITDYIWYLYPGNVGIIESIIGDSVIEITFNPDFNGQAELYAEMRQGSCKRQNSQILYISVSGIQESPDICIVGMDQPTEKCRIVWNRSTKPEAAFYTIYRESNEAGVFLKLASIPADGPGIYVDSTSVPFVHTHSYKISLTDTFNNESARSDVHTTMLLSSSLGTNGRHNLNWTHYVGHPFLTYEIHQGNNKDTMSKLTSVASNVSSYIVQDPLPGLVYYQIVASREGCDPVLKSGTNYGETRSNINELVVNTEDLISHTDLLHISPNPTQGRIEINYLGRNMESSEIRLLNLVGQVLGTYQLDNSHTEIDVSQLSPGIYLIHLDAQNTTLIRKLVIRR